MERSWTDPRTVRRRHSGVYQLRPEGPKIMIGREAAVECVKLSKGQALQIRVPARTLVVPESALNRKGFHPETRLFGDPNRIVRRGISLGTEEGVDNRVYLGHRISIARIPSLMDGFTDIIVSTAERVEIVEYSWMSSMYHELQAFYPLDN